MSLTRYTSPPQTTTFEPSPVTRLVAVQLVAMTVTAPLIVAVTGVTPVELAATALLLLPVLFAVAVAYLRVGR